MNNPYKSVDGERLRIQANIPAEVGNRIRRLSIEHGTLTAILNNYVQRLYETIERENPADFDRAYLERLVTRRTIIGPDDQKCGQNESTGVAGTRGEVKRTPHKPTGAKVSTRGTGQSGKAEHKEG